jgi:UDP-2,3-diacylglucosamine hydrolase
MSAPLGVGQDSPLAMICGGGSLPLAVADSVRRRGRRVVLFPLHGFAEETAFEHYPHHWVYIGQVGKFMRLARAAGCRDVVFIGSVVRPSLWHTRADLKGLMMLPRVISVFRGGDNHVLSGMGKLFEQDGFRMLGAHEVAPDILVPAGTLSGRTPSDRDRADVAMGFDFLRATSPFDVGQAVVVAGNHVLAVEAAEGTDHMLTRVAELRAAGRIRASSGIGVLVKAPKRGQDLRFDMPSIGPQTVEGVARAGLAGIAVVAGETIIAEPERVVTAADRTNIFVIGTSAGNGQ